MDKQRSNEGMTDVDEADYDRLYKVVAKEVTQLRVILEGIEAKEKERVWIKNQNQGELDDNKLVDGATGERNIFKKRGNNDPMLYMLYIPHHTQRSYVIYIGLLYPPY
jgi:hypothetical protein